MMQTFASLGITTMLWVIVGYSLCFSGDVGGIIGNLDMAFLKGISFDEAWGDDGSFPTYIFIAYQMMFAVITLVLITGAFINRITFKAFLIFLIFWQLFVYYPFVHMIWGGGIMAVQFKNKLGWDDALDVWGVHGIGGVIGTISLCVFASTAVNSQSGLLEGDLDFFTVQVIAVVISAVYAFVFTYAMLAIINLITPVKVTEEQEIGGIDNALHGEKAYDEGVILDLRILILDLRFYNS